MAAVRRLVAQLAVALVRGLARVHHQTAGDELHSLRRAEPNWVPQVANRNEMNTAPHRCKILAHMFRRIIRNLDQIQNSSTAQACVFDQSKIDIAKDAIHDVVEELEARAAADIEQR